MKTWRAKQSLVSTFQDLLTMTMLGYRTKLHHTKQLLIRENLFLVMALKFTRIETVQLRGNAGNSNDFPSASFI